VRSEVGSFPVVVSRGEVRIKNRRLLRLVGRSSVWLSVLGIGRGDGGGGGGGVVLGVWVGRNGGPMTERGRRCVVSETVNNFAHSTILRQR
jgi:hypothetical protein